VVNTFLSQSPHRPVAVESGHGIAAPYAGMILGELGAEMIAVETPTTGDAVRDWGRRLSQARGLLSCGQPVPRAASWSISPSISPHLSAILDILELGPEPQKKPVVEMQ
jgi:hypothetical protein